MLPRSIGLLALTCVLEACAFTSKAVVPNSSAAEVGPLVAPEVAQKGKGAQWVSFAPHSLGALYSAIVLGPMVYRRERSELGAYNRKPFVPGVFARGCGDRQRRLDDGRCR